MESAEIKFNLASEKFKVKLVEFEQSIKSFKENKNLEKLKVDNDLIKDEFAEWINDELVYWSSMDSIERKNCFTKKTFEIENDYLNLFEESNKLILEADSRNASNDNTELGIDLHLEYLKSLIKSTFYLPKFRLPRFSGNRNEWKKFAHRFKYFFHDNLSVNDERRFWYLKALLDKEKAPSIEHYTNYIDAWQYLEQYFADPPM